MTPTTLAQLEAACAALPGSTLRVLPPLTAESLLVACFADTVASAACRDFTAAFARYAVDHPEVVFVWIDIASDADLVGPIDRTDLPAWAVYRGRALMHFSPAPPALDELADTLVLARHSVIASPGAALATMEVANLIDALVDRCQIYVVPPVPPAPPVVKTVTKDRA